MVRVKICGITRLEDALAAADCGASALGFVFAASSPRCIDPAAARAIIAQLPPFVERVGVFVDAGVASVEAIVHACQLTRVQLHGMEDPVAYDSIGVPVDKAITLRDPVAARGEIERHLHARARAILVDRPKEDPHPPSAPFFRAAADLVPRSSLILAGGINCENVFMALETARPAAIDLARGVEDAPGRKNPSKLRSLFRCVRQWERLQ